jgi:hypothetical protein
MSEGIVEGLKTLQKIHCRTCAADYDACQKCRFHQLTNKLLCEALNELRRPVTRETGVIVVLPELEKIAVRNQLKSS